ncbi:AAA family ATPase [Photobacterium kagoshimensis]|uniref:AAA family ATPase n=1 Tax=Photobacterium kagoshimensis TaxID=2910242 RepID=UPI003D0B8B83
MTEQQVWDDFIARWPRDKLVELTLEQYVSTNDNDTFTYWLETRTSSLGSIRGNTSAKFGIYKRGSEAKEQSGIQHNEVYSFRTRYGADEQSVFNYVKQTIIAIANAAHIGDLESIEKLDFSSLVKWKIAFLYQNSQSPSLINTFSEKMLKVLTGDNAQASYSTMYRQLIEQKGEIELLEYGKQCWTKAEAKMKQKENQQILDKFLHIQAFSAGLESWSEEIVDAFCNLMTEANKQKLDVFITNMSSGGMIRIGRKENNGQKATSVFATFEPTNIKIKFEQRYLHMENYFCGELDISLVRGIVESKEMSDFSSKYPITRKPYWPNAYSNLADDETIAEDPLVSYTNNTSQDQPRAPLNQILYGPPGTGKTYRTMEAAVSAASPEFRWTERSELKAEYERLVADKRIRFVTFHQSYGYEAFVEGLTAESDGEGNISYVVKDGVFKSISDAASAKQVSKNKLIKNDARIWQLSIESSGFSEVKEHCLTSDFAAIGWGHVGDMTSSQRTLEDDEALAAESNPNQSTIRSFCNHMSIGDIVFCVSGQWTIEAIGVVTGDYKYQSQGVMYRTDYKHTRPIKWLAKGLALNVYDLNCNTRLPIKTCSELTRFTLAELLIFLDESGIRLDGDEQENENCVLVIDEINRGNISKIFGELITLIEPSKRKGAQEALEVSLPFSGKPFSVPNNLHIIGTMNTADRSLTMMDTALRRRFDFTEMMPIPELLRGKDVCGINLSELLETMNQRITVLLDREHTLGHAFFFPAYNAAKAGDQKKAFEELQSAFKNKIIPLLQEYFFEDWNKIRLVLGDNQKDESLCFVEETQQNYSALFGGNHGLDIYEDSVAQFSLASFEGSDTVWDKPEAYSTIYSPAGKLSQTSAQIDAEQ